MPDAVLNAAIAEIETHVHAGGWDRGPTLFALVRSDRFTADDPETAQRLGLDALPAGSLTPVEQDDLPDVPLDEMLGGIAWPDSVSGCAVTQEIVVLPPSAEGELDAGEMESRAADHPDRREARLVVGVLREGETFALLRLRASSPEDEDDLVTGADLAPNLVTALRATFD